MSQSGAGQALSGSEPILFEALRYSLETAGLVVAAYLLLGLTSGRVVRQALRYAGVELRPDANSDDGASDSPNERGDGDSTDEDTGRAIGKIENVLVLTLMVLEAYTALGVIFAAKSLVRKDDMAGGNTSYYLTGTLANYTYSIAVGVGLHVLLWAVITHGLF